MEKIRLKDLNNVSSDVPVYADIMEGVCEYKNNWIGKRFKFKSKFIEAFNLVQATRQINITLIELNRDIEINVPNNIDNITYKAMMEIQSLSEHGDDVQDYIANMITKACFSENYKKDYSTQADEYDELKKRVLSAPLEDMMGIYNWIIKGLDASNLEWKKRFMSVQVDDPEYTQADGGAMAQFNVIRTIKNICKDFNVGYDQAWQLSYALTQTSSYEVATQNNVQDKLRIIKEAKFKASRNNGQ